MELGTRLRLGHYELYYLSNLACDACQSSFFSCAVLKLEHRPGNKFTYNCEIMCQKNECDFFETFARETRTIGKGGGNFK